MAFYLLALVALGGGIACLGSAPSTAPAIETIGPWRRTAWGWERGQCWTASPPGREPALHPALVCVGEALASLLALGLAKK